MPKIPFHPFPVPRLSLAAAGCFCLIVLSLSAQPDPDLLVYEGFDYDVGSSIEYLEGGEGWGSSWLWRTQFAHGGTVVMNGALVEPGSLGYGDLKVSGNHVRLTGENGELQLGREFAHAVGGEAGTRTYISYVGQRTGPLADPASPAYGGNYPWGSNLYPRGASLRFWNTGERLSIGNFSNQTQNTWSVYGSGLPLVHSDVSFSGDLALVVARIDHTEEGGPVGDTIYLWINPDLEQPEDPDTADIRMLNVHEDGVPVQTGALTWISPFAGHASVDSQQRILRPYAELLVDEIRVGRTYASVLPVEKTWNGFEMDADGNVFTGRFLKWVAPVAEGWIRNHLLQTWQLAPESWADPNGSWIWASDTAAMVPAGEIATVPWVWSEILETWMYVPDRSMSDGEGFVYVWDGNTGEDRPAGQAFARYPVDGDQHVETPGGTVKLEWRRGQRSTSHEVYYGTDLEAVANATPESPQFLGHLGATTLEVAADFHSMEKSYWRVDAVNASGTTKGDVWWFRPAQLAFPGAEGWGRFALGGRHGRVVHVTNLNDSGPGSLRWAVEEESGPRIIVFDVGGLITLESHLTIDDEDTEVTVAGQTAPYPGITIRKHKLGVSGGSDVVVRFLRLKVGNLAESTSDGTGLQGSNNSIMDHLSVGWSIDEAFSSRNAKNITLQRTMLEEALNVAGHKNYPDGSSHGYAASVGGDIASFHHNLLAHCAGRNWSLAGGLEAGAYAGRLDFTNNIVYNWGHRTTDGGAREVNFVRNYYKGGPSSSRDVFLNPQHEKAGTGTQRYFVEGNILDMKAISSVSDKDKFVGPENQEDGYTTDPEFPGAYVDAPFFENHVTTHPATLAYKLVLSDVGANQPAADDHDYRIIGEVLDRSFTYRGSRTSLPGLIDNEGDLGTPWDFYGVSTVRHENFDTDRDGLPDWYEAIAGTNPDSPAGDHSDMRLDPDGDGFTLMDDYLAWLAAPHFDCPINSQADVDLPGLSRGFTDAPVFSIDSTTNGETTIQPDGSTARFIPETDFSGLAEFTFTVTDAEGDSMTRTVGLRVVAD